MARVAVVIASKGRPEDLGSWLDHVRRQTLAPDIMIWAVTGEADLPLAALAALPEGERPVVRIAPLGLCRQRNAALDHVPEDCDIVAFFDDDYVPSARCLEGIATVFERFPTLVGTSGRLLADGINGPGIPMDEAMAMVAAHDRAPPAAPLYLRRRSGLYGCNMAFRRTAMGGERFDEALPFYGWQEDVDYSARIGRVGLLAGTNGFAGVHRGAKGGRTSGVRFGYSQVANIIYLCRKGTMAWTFGGGLLLRNFLANHLRAVWSEPWTDRRGRVRGNWLAIVDLLRGRLHPGRVTAL